MSRYSLFCVYNPTKSQTTELNWEEMKLKNKRALKNFLVQIMLFNPDLKSYMINMRKRFDEVGAERLLHTISLYLFGIYVAKPIGYSNLIRSKSIENAEEEFLQFWSCICLCHDMGYFLEKEKVKKDKKEINTLKGFMEKNGIFYDCKECMDSELVEGYYQYRLEKNDTIDHGITGAYFIYDMLMKSSEKKEKWQKEVKYNCQSKKFSAEEIRKRAKHYASIIARHNM